jgi:hypothetical protein
LDLDRTHSVTEGSGVSASASPRSAYARIVTNFVHDMSTGTWAACLLVIWTISTHSRGVPVEAAAVLADANQTVFWLLVVSLVGLAVTGAARLFYWRSDSPPDLVRMKRRALIVKHACFLLIYGLGTMWAARMVFA